MTNIPPDFIVTHEHRRFAEFCDACRRYRYIGLCYGSPGVGKSLSAQHYANWFHLQTYVSSMMTSPVDFATVAGSTTVFYTPDVVNAPRRIAQDIAIQRHQLRLLAVERNHLRRDKLSSIAYSAKLSSSTISATLQSTDRHHGIVGQQRSHFQRTS